ncbi:uncharacterized protein LY89DRAFT_661296 [Mollisia scopiformis]|uniref:Zn(2)-C6 fungal-type domain-containing protein n=1 Tax=Mollisia scopiformis TaxID=149040 RepID=A0A132B4A2_MOLSC|nr:uncharacterized protein LY89DRAFT_661296 [Mollisia scopiformis]KUJ07063.1 hypothetical protein LY89DRAFT_661296 [Mollisia scopiformis]
MSSKSVSRRGRACDACHTIKIKCELGSTHGGDPPCERCIRLGKQCSVTTPVRQKDRIAELEARIEEVTKLLRLQEIQEPSSHKANVVEDRGIGSANHENGVLDIDHVLPRSIQMQLLEKYRSDIEPVFPFAIIKSYETLRGESPVLLQAVIFVASLGRLSTDIQDELTSLVMDSLTPDEIAKAKKSIEMVQAILIASFWYRPPKSQIHTAIDRFLNLAVGIAEDIGISTSDCALGATSSDLGDRISSTDAWRTWSLCYLLSTSLSSCMRISPKISWNPELEMKLSALEYGRDAIGTDRLLCQFVHAEKLCQQIILDAGYNGNESTLEVTDHATFQRLRNFITDRKAQVYTSLRSSSLSLYEHIPALFLHECILHTPTNNSSFAAPYIAERLSLTDFPSPMVTPDHVDCLYSLRDACHCVLNAFLSVHINVLTSSPMIVLNAKGLYAMWLLIKLYVATTASGNTYGAFIDPESLDLETYLGKLAHTGDALQAIDPVCVVGKGLQSTKRLMEWVWNYNTIRASQSYIVSSSTTLIDLGLETVAPWKADDLDLNALDTNALDYGLEDLFGTDYIP